MILFVYIINKTNELNNRQNFLRNLDSNAELAGAERDKQALRREVSAQKAMNEKIRKEVEVAGLTKEQTELVHVRALTCSSLASSRFYFFSFFSFFSS